MFTWWLEDQLFIKWFQDGGWKNYPLIKEGDKLLSCSTSDHAKVEISINEQHIKKDDVIICYEMHVTVHPNEAGYVTGVELGVPVHESLKCTWKPHLAPEEGMTISEKAFRSPAIIVENEQLLGALIPDLNHLKVNRSIPHVMDYVMDDHCVTYGFVHHKETGHVYYEVTPQPTPLMQPVSFRFFLVQWSKNANCLPRDYRPVELFLWNKFVNDEQKANILSETEINGLKQYVDYTYDWAFNRWRDVCWQEFELEGQKVGGVVFIVTAQQKPGSGKEEVWREPKSLWNQAWFSSLRSAYGYRMWGELCDKPDWIEKSNKALNFALSAPQINGLFPGYYEAGEGNRWDTGRWVMSSSRRPKDHDNYVHLLDASWTCIWLLKWYLDIEQDARILPFVNNYVKTLLSLQKEGGYFPAWVHPESLASSKYLQQSPETAVHVILLCLLNKIEPNRDYIYAAERAAKFLTDQILVTGRWEDFETYWSCSQQWEGKKYGIRDARSGLYNQCNFGIYWVSEAFKELFQTSGNPAYLEAGEQALAELSLYQQIWQPPFFSIPTFGGFGVMTSDDEWNDARQSLFALTYLDYYRLTGKMRYLERGLAAMKASFYMMYCPENEQVRKLYEEVHPHFNEMDYGFNMENYNHHDGTEEKGLGEFTIFDWGNGAAATSLAQLFTNYKKIIRRM